jgi:deoxyribonuclease V
MILALDAYYDERTLNATGAAVVFEHWDDAEPLSEYTAICEGIQPYQPGEFYKRELPCLLAVLETVHEPMSLIVVDGYVSLGDKPGLGWRLWEALDRHVPVIGVAKTRFRTVTALEVLRGQSQTPLYVTAAGMEPTEAAEHVRRLHGPFRIPTLLTRVDWLARGHTSPSARAR